MKLSVLKCSVVAACAAFPFLVPAADAATVNLGTAGNFAVLAGAGVTNTGSSVIDGGDIGSTPTGTFTGFGANVLVSPYVFHSADAVALQAQTDLTTAYNTAAAADALGVNLTGSDLGSVGVLTPGTYFFTSSAQLTGTLTLNNLGNADAQFVFQIVSTLTTASDSVVQVIGDTSEPTCNIFWQVGSSATLGTGTRFQGHILALTDITLNTDANIVNGSALARNGAVTLDSNDITNNCFNDAVIGGSAVPLPAAFTAEVPFAALAVLRRQRQR